MLHETIDHVDATLEALLTPRPPSLIEVEDTGSHLIISTGDDGLTLTPEEAQTIVDKLCFALQERDQS